MNSTSLAILGSCVTRDAWRIATGDTQPQKYFARMSLISLMSPALELDESEIALDSPFQRRSVFEDASRAALPWLAAHQPRILLLDFIDDRFDVYAIGSSYLLASEELQRSGLIMRSFPKARLVSRLSAECSQLWQAAVKDFACFMFDHSPRTRVVLHQARFATSFLSGACTTPFAHMSYIESRNRVMIECERAFMEAFPAALALHVEATQCVADPQHEWGLSPIHFVDSYYHALWQQLAENGAV